MKLKDIVAKTDKELNELLVTSRNELSQAVIDSRTKEENNTKRQAGLKRQIARTLTVLRQRELTKLEEK